MYTVQNLQLYLEHRKAKTVIHFFLFIVAIVVLLFEPKNCFDLLSVYVCVFARYFGFDCVSSLIYFVVGRRFLPMILANCWCLHLNPYQEDREIKYIRTSILFDFVMCRDAKIYRKHWWHIYIMKYNERVFFVSGCFWWWCR